MYVNMHRLLLCGVHTNKDHIEVLEIPVQQTLQCNSKRVVVGNGGWRAVKRPTYGDIKSITAGNKEF